MLDGGKLEYNDLWDDLAITTGSGDTIPMYDIMTMGDVNKDNRDDIVYIPFDSKSIVIRYVEDDGSMATETINLDSVSYPTLCLPNVDNDSAVVRYTGHELLFTDPIIVAVLASPPYWSGINENGLGGTCFGYVEGHATGTESSQGFSTSLSIGTSFSLPFNLGDASLKNTVESSMNWGTSTTHEITESWGYSTSVGTDKVIFTSIPFDVYHYEILSSPVSSQTGQTLTVNVPRAPGKYHQSVEYYNAHNGDGYDIGAGVLVHTKGNPKSYLDKSERDQLKSR